MSTRERIEQLLDQFPDEALPDILSALEHMVAADREEAAWQAREGQDASERAS